ncbi:MAG: hypothetical protein WBC44_02240 [Planctomycetaceae bacterium]
MPAQLKSVKFKAPKVRDSILLDRIRSLAGHNDCQKLTFALVSGGDSFDVTYDQLSNNDTLRSIAELDSFSFESITVFFNGNASVRVHYIEEEPLFLQVSVSHGQLSDRTKYLQLIAAAKSELREVSPEHAFNEYLNEDAQRYIQTRDLFLERQEQTLNNTIHRLNEYVQELTGASAKTLDLLNSVVCKLHARVLRKEGSTHVDDRVFPLAGAV